MKKVELTNACVMVTSICNENCIYCFRMMSDHFLEIEKVPFIAELLKKLNITKISITGGEPLLHPKILEIADIFKNYDFTVSITTNASRYVPEIFDYFDIVTFSLDSLNPQVISSLGRRPNYINNIKLYLSLAEGRTKPIKINTVITSRNATEGNIKELAKFISLYKSIKRWKLIKFMKIRQVKELDSLEVKEETFRMIASRAISLIKTYKASAVVNITTVNDPYLIVRSDGKLFISQNGIDKEFYSF